MVQRSAPLGSPEAALFSPPEHLQNTPQAAPSFGQPRPIGRLGRLGCTWVAPVLCYAVRTHHGHTGLALYMEVRTMRNACRSTRPGAPYTAVEYAPWWQCAESVR